VHLGQARWTEASRLERVNFKQADTGDLMSKQIKTATIATIAAIGFATAVSAQYLHPTQATTPDQTAPARPSVVDDREIALRVQAALGKNKDVSALSLTIKVTGGNVELNGIAPSQIQVDRALEIVRTVPGVKSVRSDVRIG